MAGTLDPKDIKIEGIETEEEIQEKEVAILSHHNPKIFANFVFVLDQKRKDSARTEGKSGEAGGSAQA